MELSAFQVSKIELIAEYESAVMELYWVFSEKFPEHKDFWIDMADDERKIVEWVHSVIELIKANKIEYNRDRFNIEAVRTAMNFIKAQIRETLDNPMSLQAATATASGIEDSLTKRRFYEMIKDDNQEARQLYHRFAAENQKHRDKLSQFRQRFK
jgi:hypothetical protein